MFYISAAGAKIMSDFVPTEKDHSWMINNYISPGPATYTVDEGLRRLNMKRNNQSMALLNKALSIAAAGNRVRSLSPDGQTLAAAAAPQRKPASGTESG